MEFSGWLKRKFLEWQVQQGEPKTQAQFAAYIGVPPTSFSNWVNSNSKPRAEYIAIISAKLGPEIYEILGMPRETGDEEDQLISERTRHLTPEKKRQVLEYIRQLQYLDVPDPAPGDPILTPRTLAREKK